MSSLINIAVLLLALAATGFLAYGTWYVARGRHLRERRRRREAPDTYNRNEKEPEKKDAVRAEEKTLPPEKEYCYPSINDVMGYEFVTIVRVKDSLRGVASTVPAEAVPEEVMPVRLEETRPRVKAGTARESEEDLTKYMEYRQQLGRQDDPQEETPPPKEDWPASRDEDEYEPGMYEMNGAMNAMFDNYDGEDIINTTYNVDRQSRIYKDFEDCKNLFINDHSDAGEEASEILNESDGD